jgi:four helix bundle protein
MASYYRNLEVWKKAFELNKLLHILLRDFPSEEKFALTDQIRRAALSIVSNIAEWSGRWSDADYSRFLHIAKWSAMEVETQLLLAEEFWYINHDDTEKCLNLIDEILRMIFWMIKK